MARKKRIDHHQIVKTFAARLRELRGRIRMSQLALAKKASVNVGYIGKLERSESAPGLDMVGMLAEALGVPVAQLVSAESRAPQPIAVTRAELQRQVRRLEGRKDARALEAVTVVLSLVDNALARQP